MTDEREVNTPIKQPARSRRYNLPRLEPDKAQRQGAVTRLAFHLLGRDRAILFLNSHDTKLGGRPLDVAIASAAGCALVEAALFDMRTHDPVAP